MDIQEGYALSAPVYWKEARKGDYAVIGDPIDHSLSPAMHQAAYRELGLDLTYNAFRVPLGEVALACTHLRHLGYQGINVTVPLKEDALAASRLPDDFSRLVGAANTLRLGDMACTNTDGPGFIQTLQDLGIEGGSRVLLLGAGGSARSIARALYEAGYRLCIYNRTPERAERMVRELRIEADLCDADPRGASLIVNATSAGLLGGDLPVLWDRAEPNAVAYDLVYKPEPTPFLQAASAHGLRTIDGKRLLVAQGALSFEWWLGIPAPREAMLASLG